MYISNKYFGVTVTIVLSLLCNTGHVESSADIMRDIAKGIAKGLEECKKELNIDDKIMAELYHFWKGEYGKVTRDLGCTIICMSKKLDLLGGDSKMHHENAKEFAKSHGAGNSVFPSTDEAMAKKIVAIIHGCEKANDADPDECLRVLEVAKCFRNEINGLSWTPNMMEVLEEIIVDV